MIAAPVPTPEEYVAKIREHLTAIQASESAKAALEEANAKLAKSKRTTWGSWVEHNLGIKRPTADVYIRLWENKDALKAGGAKSISQARAMLPRTGQTSKAGGRRRTGRRRQQRGVIRGG